MWDFSLYRLLYELCAGSSTPLSHVYWRSVSAVSCASEAPRLGSFSTHFRPGVLKLLYFEERLSASNDGLGTLSLLGVVTFDLCRG